jgi:hypothetical protein
VDFFSNAYDAVKDVKDDSKLLVGGKAYDCVVRPACNTYLKTNFDAKYYSYTNELCFINQTNSKSYTHLLYSEYRNLLLVDAVFRFLFCQYIEVRSIHFFSFQIRAY